MFLSNLTIRSKIILVLIAISVVILTATALIEFQITRSALERASFDKLTAVREMKAQQIEDYFSTINKQMLTFAESEAVENAVQSFSLAFNIIEGQASRRQADLESQDSVLSEAERIADYYRGAFFARLRPNLMDDSRIEEENFLPEKGASSYLQDRYIASNENPTGEKERLDASGDGSVYDDLHRRYHPLFRSFLEKFGYYDIFLVEPDEGHIVYSVYKEVDFATSLLTGPYSSSGLAQVVRQAMDSTEPGELFVADFAPYAPSYNAPAAFIASPIFSGDELLGIAAFQMPVDRINEIMTSRNAWSDVGLGSSGETYIVGSDYLMRNQSRFLIEDREQYLQMIRSVGLPDETIRSIETFNSSIGLQRVETKGTVAALSGKTNTEIFPDYRGVDVLSSYRPLELDGLDWVIMSEIDEAEAFAAVTKLQNSTIIVGGILLIVVVLASLLLARTLSRPIKLLTAKAEALADGDLDASIEARGEDEIAVLARSFESMRQSLRGLIEGLEDKVAERTRDLQDSEARARAIVDNAADGLIVLNEDGIIETFSPASEKIFGHSTEAVLGQKVNMLMPEPMRSEHDAYMHHYYDTGEKRVIGRIREVTGLHKDGREFPMDLTVGEFIVGGKRLFVGIVRDITERKVQEKKLADQLAFNEALIDAIPNPIFVKTPDTKFVAFNQAYEEAFGIEGANYVGKTVLDLDFVPQAVRQGFQDEDEKLLETGGVEFRELPIVLADEQDHQMLYWTRVFDLSDGERGGLLGVLVDITRQKELERQLSIANKRMGDELNIGRQIQMSMIPLTFPRFPEHKDLDVWAFIRPAREVGGDFYDFFFIDDHRFGFVIADVSGKGVPAALLMAVAKTLLKAHSQESQSTAKVLEVTNNELSENNADCMFITAFFGIIDTEEGLLTYTNAGHNPAYFIKPDGRVQLLAELHGPMIGVMEGVSYEEAQVKLEADDKLLVYTDGITEAFNREHELYGEDRLSALVDDSRSLGTKYLVDALIDDVDSFVDDAEQADDITAFCLRYVAWDVRDDRAKIELHLSNELPEIDRCLRALEEFCDRFHLSDEIKNGVSIVLDDLLNNIINYAFQDEEKHIVDVAMATDTQRFIVTVTDDGVEFDPFAGRDRPDTESDLGDREIGGLGIHLIRNLMDDCSYRRIDEKNVTILMKRIKE